MKLNGPFYEFQFYYIDNDGTIVEKIFEINDPISFESAEKMAKQHISKYRKSSLIYLSRIY